ncbi:hypothetical protein DsansV1_C17g0145691 [Dioscorea sansibarensis]
MADSGLPRPPAYHQPVFIPPPPPRRRRRSCCFRCFCCCCCFLLIVILLLAGAITAFTLWLSPSLPSIHLNHLNPSNNGTISLSLSVENPNVRPIRFLYRAMNVRVTSKDGELVALGTVPGFSQGRRNTTGLKVNAKVVDVKEMKKDKVVNVWVDCSMDVVLIFLLIKLPLMDVNVFSCLTLPRMGNYYVITFNCVYVVVCMHA